MSLSQVEARGLAAVAAPVEGTVPREAAQRVLDYLIFHRSLLGESDAPGQLLERYMTLVNGLKEGVHIIIPDPFQKATALLFELVMDAEFDPWEIDLARFTQQYLQRVREDGGVDFAVAGRLLYMAWSILFLQSEELLKSRTAPAPPPEEGLMAAGDETYLTELDTPEALDLTSTVLGTTEAPALTPMVRHPDQRPVSLLELVTAFGEAEVEARQALRVEELRERLREEQRAPPQVLVHGDIPEQDLEDVWQVALRHAKDEPFPFLDLWRPVQGRDRLVGIFLACLFLAKERVLEFDQERLGESAVNLRRTAEARVPVVEVA
jgi:segregation and condensation protein A